MLKAGKVAPDFTLPFFDGGVSNLYSAGKTAVLIFYKFSCPVCQFTFPFLQKIYETYGDAFYFVAIAQDPAEKTIPFRETFGITVPTLMDLQPYPVSNTYRIETVPSIFLVNEDHKIDTSFEGFDKKQLERLSDSLAHKSGLPRIALFQGLSVPELKPG